MTSRPYLNVVDGRCRLKLHVTPGAKKDAVVGEFNGRLKVSVAAPPAEGKANERIIKFVAKLFSISPSSIELIRGETSRDKVLELQGVSEADLARILDEAVSSAYRDE